MESLEQPLFEPPLEKLFPHAQVALTLEDQELLADYAEQTPDFSTIVEIGTNRGWSAVLLALSSPESAVVWTIDHGGAVRYGVGELTKVSSQTAHNRAGQLRAYRPEYERMLEGVFEEAGCADKINFLFGSSHHEEWMAPVEWTPPWGSISLLFIDGDHCYASIMSDLIRWAPKVELDGCMILHDYIGGFPAVPAALDGYFAAYPNEWEVIEQYGLSLACRRIREHQRP